MKSSIPPERVREALRRIRLECHARKDGRLTSEEIAHLCDLDATTCGLVLAVLIDSGFLVSVGDHQLSMSEHGPLGEWDGEQTPRPCRGDYLITQLADGRYALSLFPNPTGVVYSSADMAATRAQLFASATGVAVWYTGDRQKFVRNLRQLRPGRRGDVSLDPAWPGSQARPPVSSDSKS